MSRLVPTLKGIVFASLLLLAGCEDKRSDLEKAAGEIGYAIMFAAVIRAIFNK